MSERPATLRAARANTLRLRKRHDVTDVILQGIARNGKGIYQAICLKQSAVDPRRRRFVDDVFTNSVGQDIRFIRTVVNDDAGLDDYPSMISTSVKDTARLSNGFVHVMGTGRTVRSLASAMANGHGDLKTLSAYTGKENGTIRLYGTASFATTNYYGRRTRIARMGLKADCQLPVDWNLDVGEIDSRTIVKRPFNASFSDAGLPGVALAICSATTNLASDYAPEPELVTLGRNRGARTLEDIADYLIDTFNPDAVAVRYIPRDFTTEFPQSSLVTQTVINRATVA